MKFNLLIALILISAEASAAATWTVSVTPGTGPQKLGRTQHHLKDIPESIKCTVSPVSIEGAHERRDIRCLNKGVMFSTGFLCDPKAPALSVLDVSVERKDRKNLFDNYSIMLKCEMAE